MGLAVAGWCRVRGSIARAAGSPDDLLVVPGDPAFRMVECDLMAHDTPGGFDRLQALAVVINDWAETIPFVVAVYVYGSHVRGDHRPDSDIDLSFDLAQTDNAVAWWTTQHETGFPDLQVRLCHPLHLLPYRDEPVHSRLRTKEAPIALLLGKVRCVSLPGAPGRAR